MPTAFIPGITGRLYQQFAVTIAVSVMHLGVQRADALSPALAALLLRPRKRDARPARRVLPRVQPVVRAGDRRLRRAGAGVLIRKSAARCCCSLGMAGARAACSAGSCRAASCPRRTRATSIVARPAPDAASLQRTDAVCRQVEEILAETPGVQSYNTRRRLQPAHRGVHDVQRVLLRHARSRGTSARRPRSSTPAIMRAHQPRARRACPRRSRSRSRRRRSPASARRAASRSCSRTARAGTSSSSPRTRSSFMAAARKRPEIAMVMHDASCRACRRSSPTSTATRC